VTACLPAIKNVDFFIFFIKILRLIAYYLLKSFIAFM